VVPPRHSAISWRLVFSFSSCLFSLRSISKLNLRFSYNWSGCKKGFLRDSTCVVKNCVLVISHRRPSNVCWRLMDSWLPICGGRRASLGLHSRNSQTSWLSPIRSVCWRMWRKLLSIRQASFHSVTIFFEPFFCSQRQTLPPSSIRMWWLIWS
jgi:hypothetical protein